MRVRHFAMTCIMAFLLSGAKAAEEKTIAVGIYTPENARTAVHGAEGLAKTFAGENGLNVIKIDNLDWLQVAKCDVILLSNMTSTGTKLQQFWRETLKTYVKCGGNIILTHDACGKRYVMSQPLFPEYFKGKYIRPLRKFTVNAKAGSICKDLPAEFEIGYADHVVIDPSPKCQTLAWNEKKEPVVCIARTETPDEIPGGFVFGIGSLPGYNTINGGYTGKEDEAPQPEKEMLVNAIRHMCSQSQLDRKRFHDAAQADISLFTMERCLEGICEKTLKEEKEKADMRAPQHAPLIIPEPQRMRLGGKAFKIKGAVRVFIADDAEGQALLPVENLREVLAENNIAIELKKTCEAKGANGLTVGLKTDKPVQEALKKAGHDVGSQPSRPEGYTLIVDADGIVIAGDDRRGEMWGVQSLLQLITAGVKGGEVEIPGMAVEDWPALPLRGIANAPTPDIPAMKRFIRDFVVRYKCNTLCIGITEFGYQRFKCHPDSTMLKNAWNSDNDREIAEYSKRLLLDVAPFVQTFGHQGPFLANPKFAGFAERAGDGAYCPSKPEPRSYLFDVIKEMVEIYKPPFVLIGHDEIYPIGVCPECKKRDPSDLLADDINAYRDFIAGLGCKTMIFGDMLISRAKFGEYGRSGAPGYPNLEAAIDKIKKDIIISHWDYSNDNVDFQVLKHFRDKGFATVANPYGRTLNNYHSAQAAIKYGCIGMLQEPCGPAHQRLWLTSVMTAAYAWNPSSPAPEKLPYDPIELVEDAVVPKGASAKEGIRSYIDLSSYCNASCKDDGFIGRSNSGFMFKGWLEDARHIPVGEREYKNISYMQSQRLLICGKGALGPYPQATNGIKIAKKAKSLMFVHAQDGERREATIGSYTIRIKGRPPVKVDISNRRNIGPWTVSDLDPKWRDREPWVDAPFHFDKAVSIPSGRTLGGFPIYLFAHEWINPFPNDEIESVDVATCKDGVRICLFAITAYE